MSELKNRKDIIKGALVNLTGFIARSLNFAFFVVLGRLYGPEITGMYLVSWSAIDIISKISILGLDRSLIAEGASALNKDELYFYRKIAQALKIASFTSTTVFLVSILFAPVIATEFLKNTELTNSIRIMSLGLFFWTFSAVTIAASRSVRIMKYEILVKSVSEPVIMLLSSITLYYSGLGITALAVSFVISTLIGMISSVYLFSRKFSISKTLFYMRQSTSEWKNLFKKSFPTGIYDMLNLLLQRIDLFILTGFTSAATAGIYGIAAEIAYSVKKIRQSFDPIFIPVASELLEKNDKTELSSHYKTVTRWIFSMDTLLLSLFFLAGNRIIQIFGPEFTPGYTAMVILTISILINGTFGLGELFILIKNPWINILNTLGSIVVNIVSALIFIPKYGMNGAAVSVTVTYIIMNTVRIIEVGAVYELSPFSRKLALTFVSGIISIIVSLLFQYFMPKEGIFDIAVLIIYATTYFLTLRLSGATPEISDIRKWRKQ